MSESETLERCIVCESDFEEWDEGDLYPRPNQPPGDALREALDYMAPSGTGGNVCFSCWPDVCAEAHRIAAKEEEGEDLAREHRSRAAEARN